MKKKSSDMQHEEIHRKRVILKNLNLEKKGDGERSK